MEIKSVNLDQPYSSLDIYHSNTDKALPGLVILPGGSYNQIAVITRLWNEILNGWH